MTHLWWHADRTPEIDPFAADQAVHRDASRRGSWRWPTSSSRATARRSASSADGRRAGSPARRGDDVQPDVVDHRLAEALGDLVDERVSIGLGEPLDVAAEHDRPEVRLERLAGLEARRLSAAASISMSMKPAASSRRSVASGVS